MRGLFGKDRGSGFKASFSSDISRQKIKGFVDSVRYARPASALGQKCGMDKADSMAVDLHGHVLTCQNVSAASTGPNGESHLIGKLEDLASVKMKTSTHWSQRKECTSWQLRDLF